MNSKTWALLAALLAHGTWLWASDAPTSAPPTTEVRGACLAADGRCLRDSWNAGLAAAEAQPATPGVPAIPRLISAIPVATAQPPDAALGTPAELERGVQELARELAAEPSAGGLRSSLGSRVRDAVEALGYRAEELDALPLEALCLAVWRYAFALRVARAPAVREAAGAVLLVGASSLGRPDPPALTSTRAELLARFLLLRRSQGTYLATLPEPARTAPPAPGRVLGF